MVLGTEPRLFDFSPSEIGAQVAVDTFDKASFGGDRSAAGRYAAQQRWKGHQRKVSVLVVDENSRPWESGAIGRLSERLAKTASLAELFFAANHAQFNRAFYADRMKLIKDDDAVKNAKTYDELFAALSKYDKPTEAEEASLPANSLFNRSTFAKHFKFDFQRYESLEQYKRESAVDILGNTANYWKVDSNHPESLKLRVAILQEFGQGVEGKEEPPAMLKALAKAEQEMGTALFAFYAPTLRKFVRAMYEETQETLKSKLPDGTTHVRLFRGTSDKTKSPAKEGMLRRLTSWTTDPEITRQFKGGGGGGKSVFITAEIPVKQIFATFFQGLGSYTEQEVLVLGPKVDVVAVGDNTARRSISGAEADSLGKASFGGDRSAAGRYAAEQRWKNHRKKDDGGKGRSERREKFSANVKRVQALVAAAEEATGKKDPPLIQIGTQFGGYLHPEDLMDHVAGYDGVKGLHFVYITIPQQAKVSGELRTANVRWSDESQLAMTAVTIPSPEAMALEREVQSVGLEALAIADEELSAQGVTEESVKLDRYAKQAEIDSVTLETQKVLNVYNPALPSPDYDLVDAGTAKIAREARVDAEQFYLARRELEGARIAADNALRFNHSGDVVAQTSREAQAALEKADALREKAQLSAKRLDEARMADQNLKRLAEKEGVLRQELTGIKSYTERRYEIVHALLREERKFDEVTPQIKSDGSFSDSTADSTRDLVKKYIPSGIIALVNAQGAITVSNGALSSRGGSWNGGSRILTTENRPQVQLHEYIHAIAEVNPVAKLIEQATLTRRTIGSPSTQKDGKFDSADIGAGRQKINRSTRYQGIRYNFDHVKDDFAEPYAGRLYPHQSAETLTVGHDLAFTDDRTREYGITRRDDDLSASVIGLLLTLGSGK